MPVAAADIEHRYSGGTTNTDPDASLGGAMSTEVTGVIDDAVKHDLFDAVSAAEASAGDIEYRGIYIKNDHATDTLADARVYITDQPTLSDGVDIALADEAINTTIETIANEGTAPTGPTFSRPSTYAGGLVLNSTTGLAAQDYKGLWIRRDINAASASQVDGFTYAVEGTTV